MNHDQSPIGESFGFPVYNVTHRPKRKQADNLNAKKVNQNGAECLPIEVPATLTLERAIHWYEEQATQEGCSLTSLYAQTAKWLRVLHGRGTSPEVRQEQGDAHPDGE